MVGDSESEHSAETAEGGPVKSFLEHLEDFRWLLITCVVALSLTMLVCLIGANYVIGVSNKQFLTILFSIAIMLGYELLESGSIPRPALLNKTPVVIGLYYSLIVWILVAGYFVPKTFIYFQF